MQGDRDLGGLRRRELQPVTEDTTMELLWQINEKVRDHIVYIGGEQIAVGAFNTTDDKGHGVGLLLAQLPIQLSRQDENGEADVACMDRFDELTDKITRYFFRSSAKGIRLESFVPDLDSDVDVSDLDLPDDQAIAERFMSLQEETRAFERKVGFSIVLESEAQELLRLLQRAVHIGQDEP